MTVLEDIKSPEVVDLDTGNSDAPLPEDCAVFDLEIEVVEFANNRPEVALSIKLRLDDIYV